MTFHTVLIVAVLAGILASVFYKRYRPAEAIILLFAVVVWSLYGGCPLTFAEDSLRERTPEPRPLVEVGFIPYYLNYWFGAEFSDKTVTNATYFLAFLFLGLTIDWEIPVLRRILKRKNKI